MKYLPVITFIDGSEFHILVLIYSEYDSLIGSASVVVYYEKGEFLFESLMHILPPKALSIKNICPEEKIKTTIMNYLKRLYG